MNEANRKQEADRHLDELVSFPPELHGTLAEPHMTRFVRALVADRVYSQVSQSHRDHPQWTCRADMMVPRRYLVELKCPKYTFEQGAPSWATWCQIQSTLGITELPMAIWINADVVWTRAKGQCDNVVDPNTPRLKKRKREAAGACQLCWLARHWMKTHTDLRVLAPHAYRCTGACTALSVSSPVGPVDMRIRRIHFHLIPFLPEYMAFLLSEPSRVVVHRLPASQTADHVGLHSTQSDPSPPVDPRAPLLVQSGAAVSSHYNSSYFQPRAYTPLVSLDHLVYAQRYGLMAGILDTIQPSKYDSMPLDRRTRPVPIRLPYPDRLSGWELDAQRQITHLIVATESLVRWSLRDRRAVRLYGAVFHDPDSRVYTRWVLDLDPGRSSYRLCPLTKIDEVDLLTEWKDKTAGRVLRGDYGLVDENEADENDSEGTKKSEPALRPLRPPQLSQQLRLLRQLRTWKKRVKEQDVRVRPSWFHPDLTFLAGLTPLGARWVRRWQTWHDDISLTGMTSAVQQELRSHDITTCQDLVDARRELDDLDEEDHSMSRDRGRQYPPEIEDYIHQYASMVDVMGARTPPVHSSTSS